MRPVAPLVGAWIEILSLVSMPKEMRSLPSWERGLKFRMLGLADTTSVSLPSWERGLK